MVETMTVENALFFDAMARRYCVLPSHIMDRGLDSFMIDNFVVGIAWREERDRARRQKHGK